MIDNRFVKFFVYFVCYLIYPLSFLFPRKRNRIAFGSFRMAFNDNSKFLFIHTFHHNKELEIAWLSMSRKTVEMVRAYGLPAYHLLSLKGAWFALTSKVWFYNSYRSDILFCLSGGAVAFNLWHGGMPIKSIEFDITTGPLAERFHKKTLKERYYHPEAFCRPSFVLTPDSEFYTNYFAKAFRISTDRCVRLGAPRNKIFFVDEEERIEFIRKYEPKETMEAVESIKQFQRVFIYMPTWRDSQANIFSEGMDLNVINELLKEKNSMLILKPHANTVVDESQLSGLSNILFFNSKMDVHSLLPYTDVLITDYSSIMYEYMLMDKSIILYTYDYEEYIKERTFIFPFEEYAEGTFARTFEELCQTIKDETYTTIDYKKRKKITDKFWGNSTFMDSAEKIIEFVKKLD